MKVTVVMENNIPAGIRKPFLAEHGLSMLIETETKLYLFDTGQTGAIIHNLGLLGIQPAELDGIILSHGHYDHTGGLHAVLTHAKKSIPVYANEGIFVSRYSRRSQDECSYIGVPYQKELLESLGAQFQFLQIPLQLEDNLLISGPVPRISEEKGDDRLVVRCCDGREIPDTIPDDLSLYYTTPTGVVVICGCAHAGLLNILNHGLKLTHQKHLRGIIGGTHLGGVSTEQCLVTLKAIELHSPDYVAANHCTGFTVMSRLQALLGERFIPAFVGTTIHC